MVASVSLPAFAPLASRLAGHAARRALASRNAQHDANLVERFKAGDQSAFDEIVQRHRAKMHQIALGLLRNHADAEEIAQDTFLRAHRALALFRGESSLATWLHRIATNLSRNRYWYFHRRQRHATHSFDSPVREGGTNTYSDTLACVQPGPACETNSSEFTAHVRKCMARLNDSERRILQLRTAEQRSYHEIAQSLGIACGTVKSRIARARESLRTFLGEIYNSADLRHAEGPAKWFETGPRIDR
ncbi:MAG TPA: sigma-70 family RNA polymerase sigma factor [Lacunisphaera sp.]|nr:sigma-70 family RNA polymerase sigma factor [Lacunisphaera sp.]